MAPADDTPSPPPTDEEIWRSYDSIEQRLTAPVSERMLDLAALRPGMRVLDLASGRGDPAIRAAHRVGPAGTVVGVDASPGVLQIARERAAREGLSNLRFRTASVESLDGIPLDYFDRTLARWGLMYLDSATTALLAARRAMVADGLLVAAVWAEPERVPYFTVPRRILEKHASLPPIDFDRPGTFHYAESARLHRDLAAAGFVVEHEEEQHVAVIEAATGSEIVAWTRAVVLGRLLDGLPKETQQAWEADVLQELEAFRDDGFIRLGGVTRIVSARVAG